MNKPEIKPEDVANLWTLICCFQTARFCMSQIGGIAKKGSIMRDVIKRINKDIQRFLKIGQRQATAKQKKLLDKISHENAAAMAETLAIISHLPPSKIDWFCDRVNSMAKGVILSDHEKNERGDEK